MSHHRLMLIVWQASGVTPLALNYLTFILNNMQKCVILGSHRGCLSPLAYIFRNAYSSSTYISLIVENNALPIVVKHVDVVPFTTYKFTTKLKKYVVDMTGRMFMVSNPSSEDSHLFLITF